MPASASTPYVVRQMVRPAPTANELTIARLCQDTRTLVERLGAAMGGWVQGPLVYLLPTDVRLLVDTIDEYQAQGYEVVLKNLPQSPKRVLLYARPLARATDDATDALDALRQADGVDYADVLGEDSGAAEALRAHRDAETMGAA